MTRKTLYIVGVAVVLVILAIALWQYGTNQKNNRPVVLFRDYTMGASTSSQAVATSSTPVSWKTFLKPNEATLRARLTPVQYDVTQNDGTETPFQNEYWNNEEAGIYVDIVSGEPLFSSKDKYDSGTGWPSFTKPLVPANIVEHTDYTLILPRTEVRSKRADSHLGHVFTDGPKPKGLRYCMNSAALRFISENRLTEEGYAEYAAAFGITR